MASPVHGLTSPNTSTNSKLTGGSAAAGAANASATTLSRARTSLITGLLPQWRPRTRSLHVVSSVTSWAAGKRDVATTSSNARTPAQHAAQVRFCGILLGHGDAGRERTAQMPNVR